MRRKFLLKVMILSLLFVAMGGGDLFAQSVTEVSDAEGLKSALTKNGTVKLTGDIEVETTIGVPYVTVTLDLNGHSIKAKSDDIYPINNDGILTITDTKGNGVIEGLGLSSGFDNNTNAKGPRSAGAELFINGGTFRNLNSETGAAVYVHQGEATINGGSFYGRNIAIMSANGTVEINGGFIDGYESAIVSSASVKIKGATKISGQCRTENGGSIFIAPDVTVTYYQARIGNANNWTSYETLAEAVQAAKLGDEVYVFAGTYAVPSVKAGITINGEVDEDGKTKVLLEGTLSGTLENVTLKNLHIKGGNAQRWGYAKGDLYFENVTFEATSVYAIHFDGITEGANLLYKNCTIIGWAAMSGSPESCEFIDCTIKDNGTYGVIRTYFDATIEGCTFDIRNANPNDVYQDGIHAVDANVVVTECTNIIGDNGETGDMKDIVNVSGSSIVNVDDVLIQNPAKVENTYYATIQEAIVAAAPSGIVELVTDVTVDKWIMFSERLSIGNGNIINTQIDGLTIKGNDKKVTIKSIESAGNGNRLFYDATNLNIQDLTIECVNAAANQGGIGLTSGTISNVNFIGGVGVRPGDGDITISGCTFNTSGSAIYNEEERDNLVVTGNTFNTAAGQYAIYLRGNTTFTGNTVNTGKVNVVSGSPVVTGNNFGTERFKVYNAAEATISNNIINNLEFNDESVVYSTFTENTLSDDAQAVLDAASFMIKVSTKAELSDAINAAKDGDVIEMTADIDYGTDQLKIEKPITLDLGGKTLTTRNAYGGMSIKNNPTIKNGNIVHASNTAAIKVWNATAFEDLVIDVQGKGDANKTIGGIVLQSGSTTRVGSIKNVTIEGDALTNGIETYNCGDATENVIGSMENVNIDAVGTAMLISAPCGTATNCIFDGGVNGIEIWIKGNYSASLGLVDCDVVGGVFAHDEFNSNPEIVNNGTLNLTADEATTGAGVDDVTLTLARVEAENVDGVLEDVMEQAKAKVNNTYYQTLAKAVEAAETGSIITLMNGEHELPLFANKELTFKGESKEGVIVNDAPAATTQGWLGSTFHFENLTAKGATENYHGLANGVKSVTYKDCNINGLRFLYATEGVSFEGCAFNSNDEEHSFWTYGASNVTVTGCIFTYTDRAVNCYSENGADHELDITFTGCIFKYEGLADAPEGAVEINSGNAKSFDIAFTDCTAPEKGAMWFNSQWDGKKGENTVVEVNGEIVWQVLPVAKIGGVEYKSLQAALDAAAAGTGNVTVEILRDIDLNGIDWNPVTVSAPGYPVVTVKGNSKTITGLNDMLFAGTWAGGSGLIINDLTIANSNIVNDKDDVKGTVGVGAFIGFPQASATITLNNCHLVNSTVEGGHWTGGLIGYSAGYAGNDGPVFMNLTITGCSVKESIITGKGSVGGIIGHGSGNGWTDVVIDGTTVSDNTITSTGSPTNKAGAVMGTIGAAGQPTTVNGVTHTGGATVSAIVADNTVTSGGTTITTIYGRQGTTTGILELNGGSYDKYPIEEGVAYAKPAEGFLIKENTDGTFGVIALDGEGTEDNPYIIKDLAELIAFRDDVNGGNNYAGKYIALAADIDLNGENWVGIGSATAEHGFMGNFDGKTHKIKNLTITDPALDSDGYAYAGLFGVTEGTDKDNQNTIKNLTIENVTISTTGHIVSAAIAYPYYTIVDNVKVCGNITITGGDYTSGVLAYTRRCVNASNLTIDGNEGSAITGNKTVGGVISDIQMNGGLTAVYNNFNAEGIKVTGNMHVGGISGIISAQTLNTCSVKNVTLVCSDNRVGIVSGSLGGVSTVSNVDYENVTGATVIIGATYDGGKAVEAKIGDTYYATLQTAIDAAQDGTTTINILADITGDVTILQQEGKNIVIDGKKNDTEKYTFNGTINIYGDARISGEETLTIQNINFYTEDNARYFIHAYDNGQIEGTNNHKQYAHNVTVENCKFATSAGNKPNTIVGMRFRQANDMSAVNCTSDGIFSIMWTTAVDGLTLNGVEATNCTEGITIGGASKKVNIIGTTIESDTYAIRAEGAGSNFIIENSTLVAKVPVVVRNVTENSMISFTFNGTNTITENNPTNYWFVAGETEYIGTSEVMPTAPKGQVSVTLNDTGLRYEDVYGNYYELAGEGTADNPYTIANLYELKFFRDQVNAGNNYAGKYVKLTADIDLDPAEGQTRGANWTPIATFNGTFDGQNHTISNLVIEGGTNSNQGFFGNTNNGEIKNLTFKDAKVSGRLNVGVVAGNPYTSKYTNIKVTGHVEVNGMSYVGGVGGKNAYANWTNITVDVDNTSYVKANSVENGTAYRTYVGGVIGFNGEGGHTFKNISSNINVIGSTCDIGGIFGILHYSNKVENVSCSATVTSESEANELGGIAGVWHNMQGYTVTMNDVEFTGTVKDVNGEVKGVDIVGGAYNANNETADNSGSLIIDGNEAWLKVAQIDDAKYLTLAAAAAAAQANETITLLADVEENVTLPSDITFNGNGKSVSGTITAGGNLTFIGVTTVDGFSAGYYNHTINIGEGASLEVTTNRLTVSYGNVFNITGSIENAKTADKSNITPSLRLTAGASFNGDGGGVNFNVNNAYVVIGDATTKQGGATGEFNLNFKNSIVDFTKTLKTYEPEESGLNPVVNINMTNNSVVSIASHLELWRSATNFTLDESNLTVGGSFANAGIVTVKNEANFVVNAPIMSSHGGNTGTIVADGGIFELKDSNEDWENAGTMKVTATGKFITNDFKCVGEGKMIVDAATLENFATATVIDGNGAYNFEGVTTLENANGVTASYENGDVTITRTYVAKIGDTYYATLAEAVSAAANDATIELIWAEGKAPIAMNASLYGKNVTITGTATVDWNKGFLFVGRGGAGNATLTFDGANLTSASNSSSYGIHVSGREKNTNNKYDGTLVIKNSTIELDYLIDRGTITLDEGANLTVKNGFGIAGRPASETESGENATATISLINGAELIVNNHNGMGVGQAASKLEGYGIMNIDATSTFETTQEFNISANGTMNNAGTVNIAGALTNNGTINFTDDAATLATTTKDLIINYNLNPDKKVVYVDGVYKVVDKVYVAKIGENKYESLQEAVEAVAEDQTIVLLGDITFTTGANGSTNGISYTSGVNFTLDLSGKTITSDLGGNALRFKIGDGNNITNTEVTINVKNGKVVSGSNNWCAISAATADNSGNNLILNLTDLEVEANKAGDFAIKSWAGAVVNTNNVDVISSYAGGFYACGGEIVLDENSSVNQEGLHTQPYMSYAFGVSGNGKMTINGGTYSAVPAAATDANNQGTSHGSAVGGVMSSGGTLIINGGTFSNDNFGDNSLATAARYLIYADAKGDLQINGGTFNALNGIIDNTTNTGADVATVTLKGGTYSANPKPIYNGNAAIPAGYALKELANGYYTVIQIAGTQTREFATPGWYWFSTYIQFENEEVALDKLQTALDGNASMIKGQHGFTNYSTYNGTGYWSSVASALTTLSTAEMYMIRTTAQSEVELTGSFVDYQNRDITLREGWNWIGYPVSQEMSLSDAIPAGALKDGDQIKSQFDGSATYYNRTLSNGTPLVGWSGQLTQLKPGYGYMFNSASERTFNYTTDGNGAKSTLNTIDYNGENHWFADATQYPNNMTVTAMLSIDGEIVKDNYEVAAFANGECRGSARPIYIEVLDAYMLFMTIQGEDVENLTFKYYDVNYGTEYELNNTMVYSNDAIVGTIEEPYMFNLGILNIDESSVENISIYPNPTTTGKEINLQAMCDKVEVFNALGVKVAEYTNVDSIDALETAGIYVIRVTIDGNARNCRLIVK